MSQRKIRISVLGLAMAAVTLWQYPRLDYQYHYWACLMRQADHYSNVATLRNAPDRPTYNAQSRLQCEALESFRRFEAAESTDAKNKWGLKAIVAYSSLITDHHIDSYRTDRAAVYAGLGQYERGLADYGFLIANDPTNYWIYENRANLYLQMDQPAQALQDYQTLYEYALSDSSNPQAYLDRIVGTIAELERMAG
jgi:tetratricopeptide (TPR) repeat protein